MARVCVFCGSSAGPDVFQQAARELGRALALHCHTVVYGGGRVGLMGLVADEALAAGGRVIGVIPDFLFKLEVGHEALTQLEIVQTMHERKKRMADLADVFVALPGGWGTLDELAEILTWRQLQLAHQPVGLLNVDGFFDHLLAQFQHMTRQGYLKPSHLQMLTSAGNVGTLISQLGLTSA